MIKQIEFTNKIISVEVCFTEFTHVICAYVEHALVMLIITVGIPVTKVYATSLHILMYRFSHIVTMF